ncbi:MAG TPA: 1,2-phenylacetyl-CoA epoxidase subunit PaaD [Burkholderiaceae bacterium]|jgi:ring-1,2-phenylacetyl-CoA epoxidase subunit PaaD|nr:1,2-phenylacetyl-CoA epoxidase subunit PaaD [Burkholderiaceae bacterium]
MKSVESRFTPEQVMQWLHEVPDPEIPVISVVDLGIVRDVRFEDARCIVTITPTYSGCPAMREIEQDIRSVLGGRGLNEVHVERVLSPAWTTDWMSEKGREALRRYGIAPPMERAVDLSGILRRADPPVPCPQCGSTHTRLISRFGSTACKALYRCQGCGEPFDYFKAH